MNQTINGRIETLERQANGGEVIGVWYEDKPGEVKVRGDVMTLERFEQLPNDTLLICVKYVAKPLPTH